MGRLVIFSGAGLSAESGVPTFRGNNGLWNGHSIDEVCNYFTWKQNLRAVHNFYNMRRIELGRVAPNAAHLKIAEWQRRYEVLNLTTNVDDLLERAGCTDVFHLHGSLLQMHCVACGSTWPIGYEAWSLGSRCRGGKAHCNSARAIKPGVVFFNQDAGEEYGYLHRVISGIQDDDVVLVIGSSCQVVPFQLFLSERPGLKILSNLEKVEMAEDVFDYAFYRPVTESLDSLDATIRDRLG